MSAFEDALAPRGRYVKLKDKGHTITFEITSISERPYVPYGETHPKLKRDGSTVMEIILEGLDYGAESEDEAAIVLPVNKNAMLRAIGSACKEISGSASPQVGGILTVTCEGDGVAAKPGGYPPKAFSAGYELPEAEDNDWGAQ